MEWKEATFLTLAASALLTLIVSVGQAQLFSATSALDVKRIGEVRQAVELSANENVNKKKFKAIKEQVGRAFWSESFKNKLLEADMVGKVASLGSACGDQPSDGKWLDEPEGKLSQGECSFTSPKGSELVLLLGLKGSKKCVLFTFDSRNWRNYGGKGVLVAWSEGETEYMTADAASTTYHLEAEDWKDPAAKIVGVKKPFDRTFQEAECAVYVNPDAPPKDVDYNAVYQKKGRTWTYKIVQPRNGKEETIQIRSTVKEVKDGSAVLILERIDDAGKVIEKSREEQTIDLTDASQGRPQQCRLTKDEAELEAVGRKWKVRKWLREKNQLTYWMSIDIPGLIIKAESEKPGSINLVEFKEGE